MSKGELTRQAILEEATRMASEVGLCGLTIGSLADQTQLSKSGLYAHFRSKEALQVQVLEFARQRFVDIVVRPTLTAPRGEPRLRELFERWLSWEDASLPGGCIFVTAATELDDQSPGPVRDTLVEIQREWFDSIARIVAGGIKEGHFRVDTDPEQFAFNLHGVLLAYKHASRLLHDSAAKTRARRAVDALIAAARA